MVGRWFFSRVESVPLSLWQSVSVFFMEGLRQAIVVISNSRAKITINICLRFMMFGRAVLYSIVDHFYHRLLFNTTQKGNAYHNFKFFATLVSYLKDYFQIIANV